VVRGAWEITTGPRLFIAIPTKGPVDAQWALGFAQLVRRCPPAAFELNSAPAVDYARNLLVERFLSIPSAEWSLWLDTDTIPPEDAYAKLIDKKLPIVSALYRARNVSVASASGWPVVGGRFTRQITDGHETLAVQELVGGWRPGEVIPVDAVGMGCVLIHKKVFEAIAPPWFNYTMRYRWLKGDEYERADWISEDWYFFDKVKKAGFPVFLDTTVECVHQSMVNITGDGKILPGGFK